MTRVIAINLLLIFLPLIIYGAYIIIHKKPEDKEAFWQQIPLKTLFAIGFLFMFIFYVTQITFNSGVKDGIYHPPVVKDGKVIPGYIEPFKKDKSDKKSSSAKESNKKEKKDLSEKEI